MGYLFLTGATGLLGSYLIRDLSRRGVKLALLVRSTRMASAQQRVETLLTHWEKQAGHAIPRPVVLEGDLSQPDLGLGEAGIAWAAQHCDALMHNAASLTFHAEEEGRVGEPWRSNIGGTKNVLEFAKLAGIREFHHVSTAYVCGQRKDRILESELDVGQEHGNDYEISKFESEQMVRNAAHIDDLTVYRPGIIFGDSKTGYTSTFHGFYVPLKLVSTVLSKLSHVSSSKEMLNTAIQMAAARLREVMQLTGQEAKNFVPVDWVSEVMARVYVGRAQHGRTYHLTPRKRVPVSVVERIMQDAFLKYAELTDQAPGATFDWSEFEKLFLDGMSVYRSYWGDDPEFDSSNTLDAVPDLPCPELDEEMISRMCSYAIESNFGWPRQLPVKLKFDVNEHLKSLATDGANSAAASNGAAVNGTPHAPVEPNVFLGLQVNGEGGGQWKLALSEGRIVNAEPGLSPRCTATYYLNSRTFERLARRDATVDQALKTGQLLIEGNGVPLPELARILETVAVSAGTGTSDAG